MVEQAGTILPKHQAVADNFCAAPFAGVLIESDGGLRPCCDFIRWESRSEYVYIREYERWWNQSLTDLRRSMIMGPPDGGCGHCLLKETNPAETHIRHWTNLRVKQSIDQLVSDYKQHDKLSHPQLVEIRLGNACNLGCIMCDPSLSSTLAAERHRHQTVFNDIGIAVRPVDATPWWRHEESWRTAMDLIQRARYLNISGGEPFMHPRIFDIIDAASSDLVLFSANTNLTLIDQQVTAALKACAAQSIVMIGSLEGVGKHNDYLRYPSEWTVIEKNIMKLRDICRVSINHTLQHTSVYALPALLEWTDRQKLSMSFGRVYQKSVDGSGMLTLDSVSPTDHQRFVDWLSRYNGPYKQVACHWAENYKFDLELHRRYRRYVETLDAVRGTNFAATFHPNWV